MRVCGFALYALEHYSAEHRTFLEVLLRSAVVDMSGLKGVRGMRATPMFVSEHSPHGSCCHHCPSFFPLCEKGQPQACGVMELGSHWPTPGGWATDILSDVVHMKS